MLLAVNWLEAVGEVPALPDFQAGLARAVVDTALALPDDERQAFTPMLAILSSHHETQYSRLFRS